MTAANTPDPTQADDGRTVEHCPTCICGRRAPVQSEYGDEKRGRPRRAPGTISWAEHLKAYEGYAARFGTSQSAETLAARGGFGYYELVDMLGHEPETWSVR